MQSYVCSCVCVCVCVCACVCVCVLHGIHSVTSEVVVLFSVYSVDTIGSGFVVFTSRGVKQCSKIGIATFTPPICIPQLDKSCPQPDACCIQMPNTSKSPLITYTVTSTDLAIV